VTRVSRGLDRIRVTFDEPGLLANAGLLLVATLGVTNLYRALDLTPGQPESRLSFEPAFTTVVGIEKPFGPRGGFALGAQARIVGPYAVSGVPNGGETLVDAFLRAKLAPWTVATIRAQNLGNERYAPIAGYPAPGRTLQFELSTR